jgi:hypothetical protein
VRARAQWERNEATQWENNREGVVSDGSVEILDERDRPGYRLRNHVSE